MPPSASPPGSGTARPRVETSAPGVDPPALAAAVALAEGAEPDLPRTMGDWLARTLADEPWPRIMGPVVDRGAPSGVVVVGGREVARWGDPDRRDMAFSIAKSVLATVAGTAFDDGLLPDLDEPAVRRAPIDALGGDVRTGALDPVDWTGVAPVAPVADADPRPAFDPGVARTITWRQLLQQTSDWRGTLYGVPWWADPQGRQAPDEPVHAPGARFAYNDVRTNLCSLALTHLTGRSNAVTLAERVLGPLGVPDGWTWHGLDAMRTAVRGDAAPETRGTVVTTGGSHWGGGLRLSARDLARYGRLHLDGGVHGDGRLLSAAWCAELVRPTAAKPAYGLMWWRNPEAGVPAEGPGAAPRGALAEDDAFHPGAGIRGFAAHGTGGQVVWCDPDRDLVAVVRWTDDVVPILAAITAAVPVAGGPS
jgi:CubicO group peptidase (beta-lactamase class C family)